MSRFWMVRAGRNGDLFSDFEAGKCAAIGFREVGDMTALTTQDEVKRLLFEQSPSAAKSKIANAAAMLWKFRADMKVGDDVVTYDPSQREYLLGKIRSDYRYDPKALPDYPDDFNHVRDVEWLGKISRDDLTTGSKNTMGSTLTVFEPGESVLTELRKALAGEPLELDVPEVEEDSTLLKEDQIEKSREFVKDRILKLSPEEMEQLIAAVLQAMGYKARVTQSGPDRGRDVIASPDGLGLQQPRIIAEVKHRPRDAMGSQQIRSFLGALRSSDCGLYVSTGGFTKDAKYEAERASVPITLVDIDELASLVIENYEKFDIEGRTLLPLIRVYWPAT